MIGYIYLIIDLTNWKKYVGQHHYHLEKLDSNYHGSGQIIRQIYKKRPHTLKEVYLKTCYTQEELDEWEQYYIKFYDTLYPNGYNLEEGGRGGVPSEEARRKMSKAKKGKRHSDEHRKKLSKAAKGKHISEETKKKISESTSGEKNHMFGKHHSNETKKKIGEASKGRYYSEEARRKMSKAKKGKKLSEEHRRKLSEAMKDKPAHNKGVPMSEETKKKISEANKRRNLLKKMQPDGCLPLW